MDGPCLKAGRTHGIDRLHNDQVRPMSQCNLLHEDAPIVHRNPCSIEIDRVGWQSLAFHPNRLRRDYLAFFREGDSECRAYHFQIPNETPCPFHPMRVQRCHAPVIDPSPKTCDMERRFRVGFIKQGRIEFRVVGEL